MPRRVAVFFLIFSIAAISHAQSIQLKHTFFPGQTAKAKTEIKLKGNSLIGGEHEAETDLTIHMLKDFAVRDVDQTQTAAITETVRRMKVQGNMGKTKINEDLSGKKLQSTMFGMAQQQVKINPLGHVRGEGGMNLSQLGIRMPTDPAQYGGFEIPTFPAEPVRPGDRWTESGILLRNRNSTNFQNGEGVYHFLRLSNSRYGKTAVIHYKKTTDLSGFGLGNLDNPFSGPDGIGGAGQTSGLVIELEGKIIFLYNQGVVLETKQEGFWNLNMQTTSPQHRQQTSLKQRGMKIFIHTLFNWSIPKQQRSNQTTPPMLQPPVQDKP
ncbi:hypothetical protein GF373_06010 [bacterium]|nr:hypothetical protein [bacterium]